MAEYALVVRDAVADIVDLAPEAWQAWRDAGNPKADAYRPVVTLPAIYDPATQAVEERLTVQPTQVVRSWEARPLTADEMRKTWTPYQFLQKLTASERSAVRTASQSDATAADLLMMLQSATEVVSDDPLTVAGMDYFVSLGILTPARRAEILS